MDSSFAIPSKGQIGADGSAVKGVVDQPRMINAELPMAKDMSHHLNYVARNRQTSSLKQLYKYMTTPGMITMAGGEY